MSRYVVDTNDLNTHTYIYIIVICIYIYYSILFYNVAHIFRKCKHVLPNVFDIL